MNEYLTTGQMVDKLQVGEIAVDDIGGESNHYYVKRNVDGLVIYRNKSLLESGNGEDFAINNFLLRRKWRILPHYVSFNEALEAINNGKTVYLHHPDLKEPFKINDSTTMGNFPKELDYLWFWNLFADKVVKWTIAD